jgi:hypothetical protein
VVKEKARSVEVLVASHDLVPLLRGVSFERLALLARAG